MFDFSPEQLNNTLKEIEEVKIKAENLLHRSIQIQAFFGAKKYIEYCLNQISKFLGKPIKKIIEENKFK